VSNEIHGAPSLPRVKEEQAGVFILVLQLIVELSV